jgi:hypothetical protein
VLRDTNCEELDRELVSNKDFLLEAFGEEGVESELMRLHNLAALQDFSSQSKRKPRRI